MDIPHPILSLTVGLLRVNNCLSSQLVRFDLFFDTKFNNCFLSRANPVDCGDNFG